MGNTLNNHFNRIGVDVTGNKTLAAVDCGVVQNATVDAIVFTLPSTALGLTFTFKNGGRYDNAVGFAISPAAADGITGGGLATPVINKDILNLKAVAEPGNEITIVGTGSAGTGAWIITSGTSANTNGDFSREA